MTDKEKIRAEIERRIEELQPCNTRENLRAHGAIAGYYQILSFINSMQEEHVGDTQMPVIFYGLTGNIGNTKEEPVSEPNKELAETYLAVFDKKFPILPSLKGKQLADYKNFLHKCQQIFDLRRMGEDVL